MSKPIIVKEYRKKMLIGIKQSYAMMLNLLSSVDPNEHEVSEKIRTALGIVTASMIPMLEADLERIARMKVLSEATEKGMVSFEGNVVTWGKMPSVSEIKILKEGSANGLYM